MKRNRQAICIELPAETKGKLPDALQCIPAPDSEGKVRGRDGRWWYFDQPELVMRNSPERIAIDINHSTDLAAPRGAESPAAGWINGKALELRDGALYGTPKWNARGQAAIEGEEYAFLSPVFDYDASGRIQRLLRVSLVNNPNFDIAINAAILDIDVDDPPPESLTMKLLLKELGLPETATEAEGIVALNALKAGHQTALNQAQATPDLARFVPRSEFEAVQTRALNAETAINEGKKAALIKEIDTELDAAQKDGKITPASREYFRATCLKEGGLEEFRAFVKTAVPVIEPGTTSDGGKPPEKGTALNATQEAVRKSLGMTVEEFLKGAAG